MNTLVCCVLCVAGPNSRPRAAWSLPDVSPSSWRTLDWARPSGRCGDCTIHVASCVATAVCCAPAAGRCTRLPSDTCRIRDGNYCVRLWSLEKASTAFSIFHNFISLASLTLYIFRCGCPHKKLIGRVSYRRYYSMTARVQQTGSVGRGVGRLQCLY